MRQKHKTLNKHIRNTKIKLMCQTQNIKLMCQKHKTLKLRTFQLGYNIYKQEKNYFTTHVEITFFPQ